jgi:hypothetical protein
LQLGSAELYFSLRATLKENSPDEPPKSGKSDSSTKSASQLSRRTFLGNIATVGIATTAAPLLQVGELDAQQAHQPTTDVAEAPTSAGTVQVALKINGQTKNLQIEPRVSDLQNAVYTRNFFSDDRALFRHANSSKTL